MFERSDRVYVCFGKLSIFWMQHLIAIEFSLSEDLIAPDGTSISTEPAERTRLQAIAGNPALVNGDDIADVLVVRVKPSENVVGVRHNEQCCVITGQRDQFVWERHSSSSIGPCSGLHGSSARCIAARVNAAAHPSCVR